MVVARGPGSIIGRASPRRWSLTAGRSPCGATSADCSPRDCAVSVPCVPTSSSASSVNAWTPRASSPRRAAPRPDAPRLRAGRPDRRVWATRRVVPSPSCWSTTRRTRPPGGARRHTAGGRPLWSVL